MAAVTSDAAISAEHTFRRLDVLRAIAVSLVLGSHLLSFFNVRQHDLNAWPRLGRLAVFFFFVHTSLVLMFSLQRTLRRDGRHRLFASFAVRRLFRIYPLSVIVVLVVYAGHIPAKDVHDRTMNAVDMGAVDLVANLLLMQNLGSGGGNSILGPLWSLPCEVQMYMLLPALFLAIDRLRHPAAPLVVWVGMVALYIVSGAVLPSINAVTDAARIRVPTEFFAFIPCFGAGLLAYWGWRRPYVRPLPFVVLPILLTGLCVVTAFELVDEIPLGIAGCFLIGVTLPSIGEPTLRANTVCAVIARYSYGIYLTHVLAIWLGFMVFADHSIAAQWAIFGAALGVVPVALYHAVEVPMIRLGVSAAHRVSGQR